MCNEIQHRVWEDCKQNGVHMLTMVVIADVADPVTGRALIKVAELHRLARLSPDEASRVLYDLELAGEITVQRQQRPALGECYFVRLVDYQRVGYERSFLTWYPTKKDGSKIDATIKTFVMTRDAYRCRYCGDYHSLTLDHVLPSSRGGTDKIENLVTCCAWCNSHKGKRTPEEAGMVLRPEPDEQFTVRERGYRR